MLLQKLNGVYSIHLIYALSVEAPITIFIANAVLCYRGNMW